MRRIKINGKTLDEYLIENKITIGELQSCIMTDDGYEVNNPIPLTLPSGLERPPTLAEQIKRVLRSEIDMQAMNSGHETFEESNDFEVDEDNLVASKYEIMEDEYPIENETPAAGSAPAEPQPTVAENETLEEQINET